MPTILRSSREKTGAQVLYDQVSGEIAKQDFSETYDFNKARLMRRDPTLALAREMAVAPILYSSWGVEGENEDAKLYLDRYVMPFRKKFLRTAMFGRIDFGWKAYELVFKTVDDDELGKLIVPHKIKPLLNDLTWAKANKLGEFVGLRHYDLYAGNYVDIKATHCLFVNMDDEGAGDYAEPRMLRAEAVYDEWERANDAAARFDDKIAGAHWVVYYPIGRTEHPDLFDDQTDDDGKVDNALIAKNILNSLKSSGSMALPASVKAEIEELGDDGKASWSIELIEVDSKQADFVQRLKYLDALKARSMNVLERVVFEGQFGTKAESGEHTDTMFLLMELEHESLVDFVNEKLVTNLLDWNFGESQGAELKANPLSDDRKAIFADLLKMLLGDPETKQLYLATLDVDEILEALKIPRLDSAELEESDSAFAKALMALVEKDQTDDEESENVQGKAGMQLPKGKGRKTKDEETDEETDEEKEDLELAEGCGANAPGGGGFRKGNSCAKGKGTKRKDLQGEYWLQDGASTYADGDIGDMNHEAIVIQQVASELLDALASHHILSGAADIMQEFAEGEYGADVYAMREALLNWADQANKDGTLTDDQVDDIEAYIVQETDFTEEQVSIAFGSADDARVYGLEKLGWDRIHGNNIQSYQLTRSKLKSIADGLYEAFGEDVENQEFDIEDAKTGKFYTNVPWEVIADGDMSTLRDSLALAETERDGNFCLVLSDCGANAPGGGGFQKGNTCAKGGSGDSAKNSAGGTKAPENKTIAENQKLYDEMQAELDRLYAVAVRHPEGSPEYESVSEQYQKLYKEQAKVYGDITRAKDAIEEQRVNALKVEWGTEEQARQPQQEFYAKWENEPASKYDDPKYRAEKQIAKSFEDAWEHKITRAISLGELSQADAEMLGYRRGDGRKFEELPEDLWHVTTAGKAVLAEGLKSRRELGQANGKGLGGGDEDTISFTWDSEGAKVLYQSMLEAHKVATGEITPVNLLESAKQKGFLNKLVEVGLRSDAETVLKALDGDEQAFDKLDVDTKSLITGKEYKQVSMGKAPQGEGWEPVEKSVWADNPKLFSEWQREASPENRQWESFQFYKLYSFARQEVTGVYDPLFFSTDVKGFSELDRNDFKIVKVKSKPNAHGYQIPQEKEWRVLSSEAFDIVGEEDLPEYNNAIYLSECGANAKGGGGFRKGNTCAKGGKGKEKVERAPAIDTPEFKAWFKDSKIVDKGQPLQVLHGTTQNFTIFDATRGNPESDFGAGFYFTNQSDDVEFNYAGKGPDLTARMWLEVETRWNAQYYDNKEEFQRKVEEHLGKDWEAMTYEEKRSLIEKEVADEFMSNGGAIIPTYLSVQNPAIIGHGQFGNATILSNEFYQVNPEAGEDDAEFSIQGNLVDFIQAVKSNGQKYEGFAEEVFDEDMQEYLYEETSVELGELVKKMRTSQGLAHAEDYANNRSLVMSTEIIRQSLEDIGFDGIIDQTVYQKFGDANGMRKGMKGIDPDSVHFIVFDPRQIKSAIGNKGGFDPENPDITLAEGCGANAPGGGGFQKGNSCSKGDSTKVKKYRVLGTTEDKVTCEQCGKDHLKKTVALAILDPEGNETGEVKYCGTTCAAKLVLQDNANTPAVKKEASKIKKEAEAADNLAKLNEQDLKSRIDNRIKADQGLANLAFNKSGNSLEGSIGLSKDGKFARVNPEANQYEKTFYDWLIKNGFKKQ